MLCKILFKRILLNAFQMFEKQISIQYLHSGHSVNANQTLQAHQRFMPLATLARRTISVHVPQYVGRIYVYILYIAYLVMYE